jgi:hypothetical protein
MGEPGVPPCSNQGFPREGEQREAAMDAKPISSYPLDEISRGG